LSNRPLTINSALPSRKRGKPTPKILKAKGTGIDPNFFLTIEAAAKKTKKGKEPV